MSGPSSRPGPEAPTADARDPAGKAKPGRAAQSPPAGENPPDGPSSPAAEGAGPLSPSERLRQMPQALLAWYDRAARDLPWRKTRDPYRVWVSEIMLQQTRVDTVIPYYERFLAALPTVRDLAGCEEQKLLKLWEGLGYYSRVRNMQAAARQIVRDFGGAFPRDWEALRTLKGVGDYTAGAVCSIAFDGRAAAVDGNVCRVLARLTGDRSDITLPRTRADFRARILEVLPPRSGDFNQAIMDLGATVCLPNGRPLCPDCPLEKFCACREGDLWRELPVLPPRKGRKKEQKTLFFLFDGEGLLLEKRPDSGLLAGLSQPPMAEGLLGPAEAERWLTESGISGELLTSMEGRHIFTHIEWEMRAYFFRCRELSGAVPFGELDRHPLPSAFSAFFRFFRQLRNGEVLI